MKNNCLVSACIITYNQERFIAQTIEGVLNQCISNPYEIIISDDFSSDSTYEICNLYAKKFPEKIKLVPHTKNLGMLGNWIAAIKACSGKYIALCEGDDYWTDKTKLQMQVNFLEENPDFSLCFHDVVFKSANNTKRGYHWDAPEVSNLQYLLRKGCYISTFSVVYRKDNRIIEFLESFDEVYLCDYLLFVAAAEQGNIKRIKKTMGVYRVHEGGTWSQLGFSKVFDKVLLTFESIYDKLGHKYYEDLCINLLGNIDAAVKELGSEAVKSNEVLKKLLAKMKIPDFVLEYIVFFAEERGKSAFYTKNVSLSLLLGGLKEKIKNKLPRI